MTAVGDEVRLQLKPAAAGGYVDGAWWPRSRDAGVEFPGVLAAVRDQADTLALVGTQQRRLILVVVAPDTTTSAEDILAGPGAPPAAHPGRP
ncbi:Hypothetical protein AJAP_31705 [Amycolatopsis japonica]|uniref:Uncharacterized protein n=1 Tax=Amycolatopsis japonica TaxID=208439 RepID=A0A075V8J0_9PSEU|nr:DUF5994 family protein [Amycolatopsis japonica]AIG79160.1 Hypothetical protein AJAP_31705 [Amycolatopsis japonica]